MKKNKKTKYLVLVVVLLVSISLAACTTKKDVVAKIDDIEISQDELNDLLVKKHGLETLNSLISETIIKLEIDKADINIPDEEVEEEFDSMAAQYGGMEELKAAMAQANLTEKEIKDEIKTSLSLEKLLQPQMDINDAEVSKYYEENKANFIQAEQINASHILVKEEAQAKDIAKKLEAGEDFAELAKTYSIDEANKENGGSLGFFERGEMVEEFDEVAFKLKEGQISEPVKTNFGYHIIKVQEKKEAITTKLEDSSEDIKNQLIKIKMPEVFSQWYAEKVEEYDIENNLMNNSEKETKDQ